MPGHADNVDVTLPLRKLAHNKTRPSGAPRRLLALDRRLARLTASPLPLEEVVFSFDLCWDLRREREPGRKWLRKVVPEIFSEPR